MAPSRTSSPATSRRADERVAPLTRLPFVEPASSIERPTPSLVSVA